MRMEQVWPAMCRAVLAVQFSRETWERSAEGGSQFRRSPEWGQGKGPSPEWLRAFDYSERGRNRTFNLWIKSPLLCQLSYAPDAARVMAEGPPI